MAWPVVAEAPRRMAPEDAYLAGRMKFVRSRPRQRLRVRPARPILCRDLTDPFLQAGPASVLRGEIEQAGKSPR